MHKWRAWAKALSAALVLTLLLGAGLCQAAAHENLKISPQAALKYRAETPNLLVLDVRTPAEYAQGHLDDAVNIPVDELEARLGEIPADRPVLIHCRTGIRAERAYKLLREKKPEIQEMYVVTGHVDELLKK